MKANEANCLTFLKKTAQFVIPIYQRPYSWSEQQCRQLWDDVARSGKDDEVDSHFIGSIVYVQDGVYQASEVPRLLVIDGQQRLTTLSLLILALAEEAKRRDEAEAALPDDLSPRKLRRYHLINAEEEGDQRYKLMLTYGDAETLRRLVDGKAVDEPGIEASPRVMENVAAFRGWLTDCSANELTAVHRGLAKLMMIDVSLDREHDDPQLIFESLNSTGLALSQADLIRNYVLMGLPPKEQKRLYEDHWQPMERAFGTDAYLKHFDRFVRHFLTMKTRSIPRLRQVYRAFKHYCRNVPVEEAVADLHRFAGYYVRITGLAREPDKRLQRMFEHLDWLQVDTALPLLLEAYDDFAQGLIGLDQLREVVATVESYVFRRVLCDIPTNTLNKTFASLATRIQKAEPNQYLESLQATLLLLTGSRRFPGDAELESNLQTKDVYSLRTRGYLLEKLENFRRKEPIRVDEFTIEHVLPQNPELPTEWREALGANWKREQERLLHTLGNLTLTGYNSELSDRSFSLKRQHEGGFANSPLWLNRSLAKRTNWDAAAIEGRTQELTERVLKVWPSPELDDAILDRYRRRRDTKSYTLADHPKLVGSVRNLFDQLHERIMSLDPNIKQVIKKKSIGYVLDGHIVDINAQNERLRLHLDVKPETLNDPQGRVENVRGKGHWGVGDARLRLRGAADFEPVMHLIRQSYRRHGGG